MEHISSHDSFWTQFDNEQIDQVILVYYIECFIRCIQKTKIILED